MNLIVAGVLFAIFIANVIMGATGGAPFMGDVGEMLVLFAATIAFVFDILRREATARKDKNHEP